MSDVVSELGIKINADAQRANDAIDRLVGKLDRLTISLGGIGTTGNKLDLLSIGVRNLGNAMQLMNNVKTADFTRLAKNLTSLNNVDVSKLTNLSANITKISTTFSGLSGMDKAAEQMGMIANGIKQLGYKSADKAITNIPLLASAMKKLMAELSTAPKVSQNLIEMTNALAKLARTGASSGKAANSLISSFNGVSKASSGMKVGLLSVANGVSSFKRSIMQMLGVAGGFYAVFNGIKSAIDISSDLTEVQNVVDVTFGDYKSKMEDLANVSIPELGMSKLTAKEIGSRFQAMGTAIGFSQGKMSDMSVSLTRLAGDMASFYNVEQKDVAKSLQSIFTGETEPMRKYGVDLTNATLKEWAMKKGMDANISTMSQMQKTALRYQYVLEATGAAQGDFLRTQDTWANQVRILKENFTELASVIGSSFIHALKPLVKALNTAMSAIISFAKVVSNALGKIFGWKYEDTTGGIANDFSDAAGSAGDLASGTGAAAKNAKKLRQQLQGLDELNVLTTNDSGGSGGSGGGGGAGGSSQDASGGRWTQTDGMLKDFESSLDTLYKLGEYIGNTLTDTLNSIDWDSVYEGARNFGSGLASFLNGLISPELFYAVGKTIANSLNTVVYSALSFGQTFDFADFGNSIANGINGFFQNFDFKALAETLNTWVDGIETTIVEIIKNVDWLSVIKSAFDFAKTLDIDTIAIAIGTFKWFHGGKEMVAGALSSLLSKQIMLEIGEKTISVSTSIGLIVTAAIVGWKLGDYLYNNVPQVHEWSEFIVGEIGDLITGQNFYNINEHLTGEIIFDTILKGGDTLFKVAEAVKDLQNKTIAPLVKFNVEVNEKIKGLLKWFINTKKKTKEKFSLIFEEIKNEFLTFVFDKLQKGEDFVGNIKSIFEDEKNPASKLTSWVLDNIKRRNPFTGNIKSLFVNGNPESLVSWVMGKIKSGTKNLTKNITSSLIKGNSNALIEWLMGKIKSGANFVKNVTSSIFKGNSNALIEWLMEKIKSGASLIKNASINLNISGLGYNAFQHFYNMYQALKSKAITFALNFDAITSDLKSWINNNVFRKINNVFDKLPILKNHKIPYLADGGLLQGTGQLFVAREKGPEIVTSYGNKSAVMNNNQIVESVSAGVEVAVRSANNEQNSLLREQNELLYQILQKETGISQNDIFKAVRNQNYLYKKMNGFSALS